MINPSAPFIARPVATTLLTLAIALAGIFGFQQLPVAPLPQVEFPTIMVQASLPGASPETMAATVATPLERSLGAIAGVTEMTSSSSLGSTRIVLQFDLNKGIDDGAREVQAAINAARALLPSGMPSNPTYRKVNPADSPVMIVALTSATQSRAQMYDAASTVLAQRISQLEGVGQVVVGGGALPAVRVGIDLPALFAKSLDLEAVRAAIVAANVNRPKGLVDNARHQWQVAANDQARKAADYMPVIVSFHNQAPVRLRDVASVQDSIQDVRNMGIANGHDAVMLIVFRQPGSNILETVERVKASLPLLRASVAEAINLEVVMERTTTIRASMAEVERALAIAVGLVVLVVFLFLQSGRATLIPAIAVPVSLAGTFAAMYLCGYSLNNLSLMALTVATGFVVDDAIVVLENTMRHLEEGLPPLQAALLGSREVGFTVVSMSLSLIAVFIPLLAMGGVIGRLFREFAVTLSVAILVSLVISLTTTPMLCACWLKQRDKPNLPAAPGATPPAAPWRLLLGWAERGFQGLHRGYATSLTWALHHPKTILFLLLAVVVGNVWLYIHVPKGFFPQQDTGLLVGGIQADQAISFQNISGKIREFAAIVRQDPAVANVTAYTGGGQRNTASMFVVLKPLHERRVNSDTVINRLRPKLSHIAGAQLFLQAAQDLRIGGRQSNAQYQYTVQCDDLALLRQWEPTIRTTLSGLGQLTDVNTDTQDKGLQTSLTIDRDTAMRLGVNVRLVDATLNDAFGQRQVATIYEPLNQYRVVLEADSRYLQNPSALHQVYVAGSNNAMVPLSTFTTVSHTNTPLAVNHQGLMAASTISFNLPDQVSLGQATEAINTALLRQGVPTAITGSFQGSARVFQSSLASQPLLILTALVAIYITLGVLYESLIHPLTILSTLPSAGVGAIVALMMVDQQFTVIAFIGVILLIGIVKKNAIMMIDVAIDTERRQQTKPREAIYQACLLRFRPILMTTLAALFGALPLALVTGDGAELRQPLGISIVGGLVVSQLLTLYTTPVVYLVLDRLRRPGSQPQGLPAGTTPGGEA